MGASELAYECQRFCPCRLCSSVASGHRAVARMCLTDACRVALKRIRLMRSGKGHQAVSATAAAGGLWFELQAGIDSVSRRSAHITARRHHWAWQAWLTASSSSSRSGSWLQCFFSQHQALPECMARSGVVLACVTQRLGLS